jgi:bifunctional DNase/RNase
MQRIKLYIKALSYSQTHSGAYALRLREEDGDRELPIVIGGFEAQSIAIALEKRVNPPRPLTHDLFKSFAGHFGIHLKEVFINKLVDGVFYSILVCDQDGKVEEVDARTSDAVALAIRFQCPIYTSTDILEKAGIILDEEPAQKIVKSESSATAPVSTPSSRRSPLAGKTMEELDALLEQAVQDEDYELAARIRDEIGKRSDNS